MTDSFEATTGSVASLFVFERGDFPRLLDALAARGYRVIGPVVSGAAIVLDDVRTTDDLPAGFGDEQGPGTYRLKRRDDGALFGFTVGPASWKKFLFPPSIRLWQATRNHSGWKVEPEPADTTRFAFLGVRACESAALAIQDRVFEGQDPVYTGRRGKTFVVAVNCAHAGGTCFCASMGTGPRVTSGFDLLLTEVIRGDRHFFVVEIGSEPGRQVLEDVPRAPATAEDAAEPEKAAARASKEMGRHLDTDGIRDLLYRNYDHPRWDDVASRCLACANCTLACPTCFCSTVDDATDLTTKRAERRRTWDSCFSSAFSRVAGGNARPSTRARYRQWMIHKLAAWFDQFGTSGCVGCGRCITWCPVGIDITEEALAIRRSDARGSVRETSGALSGQAEAGS